MRRLLTAFFILELVTNLAVAQPIRAPRASAQRAAPEAPLRLSAERLARVDRALQRYVDSQRVAGVVALVLQDGRVAYERALGWSDREAGRRMTPSTVFRIASQTKAITSAVILSLVEEGLIGLNDPVSRWIPSFDSTTVLLQRAQGDTVVRARRRITIRDLLTHTAGISYGRTPGLEARYAMKELGSAAGHGWYFADKNEPICATIERLGTLPFDAQPGEAFVYGYSIDVLGCVAERASGMTLDELIRARITEPLGMTDTRFYLPANERDRLAAVYGTGADGRIVRAPEGPLGQGHYVDGPRRSFSGGAGLLSTARDYARFLETLRRGGALDGARILSPRTVRLMTTNQIDTLYRYPGRGFGFGFETIERYGASGLNCVGSFGWGGAYGTTYQVDPESGLVIVLMQQLMPNGTDIQRVFMTTVLQALVDAPDQPARSKRR
jgi:CubicO group peptidase (beta-lactamase class C family)